MNQGGKLPQSHVSSMDRWAVVRSPCASRDASRPPSATKCRIHWTIRCIADGASLTRGARICPTLKATSVIARYRKRCRLKTRNGTCGMWMNRRVQFSSLRKSGFRFHPPRCFQRTCCALPKQVAHRPQRPVVGRFPSYGDDARRGQCAGERAACGSAERAGMKETSSGSLPCRHC